MRFSAGFCAEFVWATAGPIPASSAAAATQAVMRAFIEAPRFEHTVPRFTPSEKGTDAFSAAENASVPFSPHVKLESVPLMDFLKGLNAQQREAVMHTEGPLLILAGAGSGKTRVITHRVAYIVTARRVPPSAVLAVTFTNKAADEMRGRVFALLEDANLDSLPNISTFHSFCVRMLRKHGDPLVRIRPGFTRRFSIYDDEDQLGIVKAIYRGLGLDEKDFMQYRAALSRISHAKNRKETAQDFYKRAINKETETLAKVFEEYEKALRTANALDFDDLLLEAVWLLNHDEATRDAWNRRRSYLMMDEN